MKILFPALAATALICATAAQAAPVALANAGFESAWTSVGLVGSDGNVTFNYRPGGPDMGWSFHGGAGVAGSYAWLTAYDGSRFGLLQLGDPTDPFGANGTYFSQSFSLAADSNVDLGFALALRPGYNAGQKVAVAVDGNIVDTLAATSTTWTFKSLSLGSLSAGAHTLGFAGLADYASYGDTTAFIDAVRLNAAPVPEAETYALMLAGLGLVGFATRRRVPAHVRSRLM